MRNVGPQGVERGSGRGLLIAACAAALLAACGAQSAHIRPNAKPGEIVWAYDGELQATKDGRVVATPNTWGGLEEAVFCVDDARRYARDAEVHGTGGTALLWSGVTLVLGGAGGGLYLMLEKDQFGAGAGTLAGGMLVGLTLELIGVNLLGKAPAEALDAVNCYNDHFEATAGCGLGGR